MAKQLYIISAGPLQKRMLAPRRSPGDCPKVRAEKHKSTCAAQRIYNQRMAYEKLEEQLAVNFPTPRSALVATLTLRPELQPKSRPDREARTVMTRYVEAFRGSMNRQRDRAGLPRITAFWAIEGLSSPELGWHVHLVLDNTGDDYEAIRKAWKYGDVIEIQPLRVDDEKNWETLARYMTKEARSCQDYSSREGLPSWSHTRNIRKPERESVAVDDDYQIEVPEDAVVLADCERGSELWPARFVKYRSRVRGRTPRARRRRRKR